MRKPDYNSQNGIHEPRCGVSPRSPARTSARKARLQLDLDRGRRGSIPTAYIEALPYLQTTGMNLDEVQTEARTRDLSPCSYNGNSQLGSPEDSPSSVEGEKDAEDVESAAAEAKRDRKVRTSRR